MGRKGHEINEKIQNKLNDNTIIELTYKKLYDSVKNEYFKDLDHNKYKYSFIRHLNGFLNSGEIEITGYVVDENRKKEQSFIPDHILLKWNERKTRPEIQNLLNKMADDNEAYKTIRDKFRDRVGDLYQFHKIRWNFLKKETVEVSLIEFKNYLSSFPSSIYAEEFVQDMSSQLKKDYTNWYYGDPNVSYNIADEVGALVDELKTKIEKEIIEANINDFVNETIDENSGKISDEEIDKIIDENIEGITNESIDEDLAHELEELLFLIVRRWIVIDNYGPTTSKFTKVFLTNSYPENFNDSFWGEIKDYSDIEASIKNATILSKSRMDEILFMKLNICHSWKDKTEFLCEEGFKYTEKGIKNPDFHFESMIDIISTYPDEEKKILMSILAKGLSDELGSINVFAEFFKKMNSINYPERLNNVLGIVSENPKTVSYDELRKVKEDLLIKDQYIKHVKKLFSDKAKLDKLE
ncbi:hypothetical protein [Methanobacterium ferruginis]|uniref:hypothetical protein n=1 Tax=Methanobacterium ferruginis TaxID=710191 RepID=UPI0025739738|nr:hypothetical protein [Methanobacterium ferruginis]BDZ67932.1 hypothetical protein GCM10025860_13800 [Methanobacterium ferruginis]